MDKLIEVLEQEVQARERATSSQATSRKPSVGLPTASTLLTGGSEVQTCCYCQQSHSARSCGVVKSPDDRRRILREAGRCFICLRKGHIAHQCQSRGKCPQCQGRHHSSICQKSQSGPLALNSGPLTSEQNTKEPPEMNPNAPTFQPPTDSKPYVLWFSAKQGVLLQTAQAVLISPDVPQHTKRIHIVLDSGSQ